MKLLVLTSRFPYPLEKGDKLRIYHQLKVLSQHFEITLISICEKLPSSSEKEAIERIVDHQYIFKVPFWQRVLSVGSGFFQDRSFQNSYFYNRRVHQKIDKIISEQKPDHIYCHLIRMAGYVHSNTIAKTIDYMDCFSAGAEKRMKASRGMKSWFFKKELALTTISEKKSSLDFNNYTIISDQDRSLMPLQNRDSIVVVKNGIDTDYFKGGNVSKSYDLGFVGNLGYYSNIEACNYLVRQVLPLLASDTRVILAGARPSHSVKQLASDRVKLSGWVEDIRGVYDSVSIFVAPLFHGIGLQNKILEAMAMGVPVVSSTLVNNAIGARPNSEILVADTPEQFAAAINKLRLNAEFHQSISRKALEFVRSHYSWKEVTMPLVDLIKSS